MLKEVDFFWEKPIEYNRYKQTEFTYTLKLDNQLNIIDGSFRWIIIFIKYAIAVAHTIDRGGITGK